MTATRRNPPPGRFLEAEPVELTLTAQGAPAELTIRAHNVTWTAHPADEWVHLSASTGDGNAVITVSATPNPEPTERRSSLQITGDAVEPVEIRILQRASQPGPSPEPEPVVMARVEGYWAGDYWDTGGRLDDLYLVMTDRTILDGKPHGAGSILSLDLNIPAATFATFDIAGTYAPSTALPPTQAHTFNADEVTYVATYNAANNRTAQRYATAGAVEIKGERPLYQIDVSLTLDDGTAFLATYEGSIPFFDDTNPVLSTLTGDCRPKLTAATGTFLAHTDHAGSSLPLLLELTGSHEQRAEHLQLLLNVTPDAQQTGRIEGTYRLTETSYPSDCPAGTAQPGTLASTGDELIFDGCWYLSYTTAREEQLSDMAPLQQGQITVSRTEEVYTIDYALTDDNSSQPHSVAGRYIGAVTFTNLDGPGPEPGDVTTGGQLAPWKPGGRW